MQNNTIVCGNFSRILHKLKFLLVNESGGQTELKYNTPSARSGEVKSLGSVRTSHSSENGWLLALIRRISDILVLTFRLISA